MMGSLVKKKSNQPRHVLGGLQGKHHVITYCISTNMCMVQHSTANQENEPTMYMYMYMYL